MDASSASLSSPLQRAHGVLRLAIQAKGGRSALHDLYQQAPCRALMPDVAPGAPLEAVLVNTSGGLVGGDRIDTAITLGPGAAAVLAGQAAEKVYRSTGDDTSVATTLTIADGAWLEWLPQETILFDGARLRRRLTIDLAQEARLLAVETTIFGRIARGERFTQGFLHDSWAIRRAGRLVWMDAIRLDGDVAAQRQRAFGFGQAAGYATLIHAGPAAASFLPLAREIVAAAPAEGGATVVAGLLLLRFLAEDAARLRGTVAGALCRLRAEIAGLPALLPRVWQV